jgi:hypothetical protein
MTVSWSGECEDSDTIFRHMERDSETEVIKNFRK